MEENMVIVSRHTGAIAWLATSLFPAHHAAFHEADCLVWRELTESADEYRRIPIIASATAEDVKGKVVLGNLPLHLAVEAAEVWAIEFRGVPPRGLEYGKKEMAEAGARLTRYKVVKV